MHVKHKSIQTIHKGTKMKPKIRMKYRTKKIRKYKTKAKEIQHKYKRNTTEIKRNTKIKRIRNKGTFGRGSCNAPGLRWRCHDTSTCDPFLTLANHRIRITPPSLPPKTNTVMTLDEHPVAMSPFLAMQSWDQIQSSSSKHSDKHTHQGALVVPVFSTSGSPSWDGSNMFQDGLP